MRILPEENMSWQRPVISTSNEGTATKGNRYIVGESPTGIFSALTTDNIAWYDGANWQEDEPIEGWVAYDADQTELLFYYDGPSGSAWYKFREVFGSEGGGASVDGVPPGGTTEQILSKIDGADYNTHWVDKPAAIWTSVFKSTDEDRINTTAFANDGQLTASLTAGTYAIRAMIYGYESSAEDIKFKLNYSGTVTFSLMHYLRTIGGATAITNGVSTSNNPEITFGTGTSGRYTFQFEMMIIVSDSGTFSPQWGQVTSGANLTRVNAGSYFEYRKVA